VTGSTRDARPVGTPVGLLVAGGSTAGTLLSVAPAAGPLPQLLRTAIDAEQVGATRIHLAADQPEVADAVDAIRVQTGLVITADPGTEAERLADRLGPGFTEVLLDEDLAGPDLLTALAGIAADHPGGASVSGRGPAVMPVLLAALAVGVHLRVGTADSPPIPSPAGPTAVPRDDIAMVARAAGLARIAGRPPLPPSVARTVLGLN
jgi:hypothetical protein